MRQHIQGLPDSLQLQAVIISPLTRAIETAIGAFGGADSTQADRAKPLMLAQEAVKVMCMPVVIQVHTLLLSACSYCWNIPSLLLRCPPFWRILKTIVLVQTKRAAHSAVSSSGCPPFIIHEVCLCPIRACHRAYCNDKAYADLSANPLPARPSPTGQRSDCRHLTDRHISFQPLSCTAQRAPHDCSWACAQAGVQGTAG